MKRRFNELVAMVCKINAYNDNNGREHLVMHKRHPEGRGRSYAYCITAADHNTSQERTILNWCWFGECHGFLKAYMKDIDNLVVLESKVQERVNELRTNEFNHLTKRISELEAELYTARSYKNGDDPEFFDNQIAAMEEANKELKEKLTKLSEELNNSRYNEVMADHGETEAMLANEKLSERLADERRKTETLSRELFQSNKRCEELGQQAAALSFSLSAETANKKFLETELNNLRRANAVPSQGYALVPKVETMRHQIATFAEKRMQYANILTLAVGDGLIEIKSSEDCRILTAFNIHKQISDRLVQMMVANYLYEIQKAYIVYNK